MLVANNNQSHPINSPGKPQTGDLVPTTCSGGKSRRAQKYWTKDGATWLH